LLGGDEWCGRPGLHSRTGGKMGRKMDILIEKNIDFMPSSYFKLMG